VLALKKGTIKKYNFKKENKTTKNESVQKSKHTKNTKRNSNQKTSHPRRTGIVMIKKITTKGY